MEFQSPSVIIEVNLRTKILDSSYSKIKPDIKVVRVLMAKIPVKSWNGRRDFQNPTETRCSAVVRLKIEQDPRDNGIQWGISTPYIDKLVTARIELYPKNYRSVCQYGGVCHTFEQNAPRKWKRSHELQYSRMPTRNSIIPNLKTDRFYSGEDLMIKMAVRQ